MPEASRVRLRFASDGVPILASGRTEIHFRRVGTQWRFTRGLPLQAVLVERALEARREAMMKGDLSAYLETLDPEYPDYERVKRRLIETLDGVEFLRLDIQRRDFELDGNNPAIAMEAYSLEARMGRKIARKSGLRARFVMRERGGEWRIAAGLL